MTDYQSIVDEMRFTIQSEDCELTDALRAVNQQYVEACREVNRQLRRVGKLLDEGLRSEALQLAEGPPRVLDSVATLTFAEAEDWAEVVSLYDLSKAEKLDKDVIDEITEAQMVEQPLQGLLAQHRRLALVRAPLRMRLAVLRQLQKADPETFTWEEDVRTFEKARFSEMATAAQTAQRSGDVGTLQQIRQDLSADGWLQRPPSKLTEAVKRSLAGLARGAARSELNGLAVELEAAFNELDFDQAQRLAHRWYEMKRRAELPDTDPLAQRLSPVLGWVQDEEQRSAAEAKYEQTIAKLQRALEGDSSAEELERLAYEIRSLDRGLPDLLATRYHNRLESLALNKLRVQRVKLGGAALVVLVLLGLAGVLINRQMRAADASRVAVHVEQLLEDRQFEAAQEALSARTDISKWEQLLALQQRLQKEQQAEHDRVNRLQQHLERVRAAGSYREATTALADVKEQVLTSDEELEYERLKGDWENRHNEDLAARQRRVQEGITTVTSQLLALDHQLEEDPENASLAGVFEQASTSLAKLRNEADGLPDEVSHQLQLLESRKQKLQQLRSALRSQIQRKRELVQLASIRPTDPGRLTGMDRYAAALASYAEALGPGPEAEDLTRAADEVDFWKAAIEWSRLTSQWPQVRTDDRAALPARIRECQKYLEQYSISADRKLAEEYIAQLQALIQREGMLGTTEAGLKGRVDTVYHNPLIAHSWCLRTLDGKVYYLPKEIKVTAELYRFQHYIGYGADDLLERPGITHDKLAGLTATPSASSQLAAWVNEQLDLLNTSNWNEFMHALCAKILEAEDMNAFLKFDLLRRAVEAASQGDVFLAAELAPHRKLLQEAPVNPLARWMDPEDADGTRASKEAADVLEKFQRLKEFDAVWKAAAEASDSLTQRVDTSVLMVGVLQRDGSRWSCATEWTPARACELRVVFVDEKKTAAQWRTIGETDGAQLIVKSGSELYLLPGRPVFAVPRTQPDTGQSRE